MPDLPQTASGRAVFFFNYFMALHTAAFPAECAEQHASNPPVPAPVPPT